MIMKYINIISILMLLLLTGCNITNHIEEQAYTVDERAEDTEREESILQKETIENEENYILQENNTENVQQESFKEIVTIAAEDVVYEENDVVFVIAKWFDQPYEYGYLISASGKVVSFEISTEELYSEKIKGDYGRIVDMETVEPLITIEQPEMEQYINMVKNIDDSNEKIKGVSGAENSTDCIGIYIRRIDAEKNVKSDCIYKYSTLRVEPTDPNAIALKDWLYTLSMELSGV